MRRSLALALALAQATVIAAIADPARGETVEAIRSPRPPTFHFVERTNEESTVSTEPSASPEGVPLPFYFTAEFKYRLTTRRFNTTTGRVCLASRLRRSSSTTPSTYTATLYRDDVFGDLSRGSFSVSTIADQTVCWYGVTSSEHYIEFLKRNDGVYVRGSGAVHG